MKKLTNSIFDHTFVKLKKSPYEECGILLGSFLGYSLVKTINPMGIPMQKKIVKDKDLDYMSLEDIFNLYFYNLYFYKVDNKYPLGTYLLPNINKVIEYVFSKELTLSGANLRSVEKIKLYIDSVYNVSRRKHHNLKHIQEMLLFLLACGGINFSVVMETLFHDDIYIPGSNNNEFFSVKALKDMMDTVIFNHQIVVLDHTHEKHMHGEWTRETTDKFINKLWGGNQIGYLIMTGTNLDNLNNEQKRFKLADYIILASHSYKYHRYSEAIEDEYFMFPKEQYYRGRLKWIESMLASDRVFEWPDGISEDLMYTFEDYAVSNLKQERRMLSDLLGDLALDEIIADSDYSRYNN